MAVGTANLLADAGHEIPTLLLPSSLTSTLGAPAAVLRTIGDPFVRAGESPGAAAA